MPSEININAKYEHEMQSYNELAVIKLIIYLKYFMKIK